MNRRIMEKSVLDLLGSMQELTRSLRETTKDWPDKGLPERHAKVREFAQGEQADLLLSLDIRGEK